MAKGALVTADDRNMSAVITFDGGNKIAVHSAHMDRGAFDARMSFEGDPVKGEIDLAFNAKFLGETLSKLGDKCTMHFGRKKQPVVFRRIDDTADIYLLMPIKLSEVRKVQVETEEEGDGDE